VPTCASCGRESADGFKFCPHCGAQLTVADGRGEQRKTVTVLFCDVAGSTALGERLDPESFRRVLARYFETVSRVLERHGGTVEKFIGDAVMAVFGVPVVHEDDALRALRAATEMREAVSALGAELERDYGAALAIRIGVNTGEVVTGSSNRLATGDAVNVAARLEQAAEPGEILLGDETFALARDALDVAALEPLELKGKSEPVQAFRLVSVRADAPAIARRPDAAMVGRERERRLLADAWERTLSERTCCLFTILGAAGVGKSRLVGEFIASVADASVLRGRCLSYGEGITYWPVVELLLQLLGKDPDAELARYELNARAADALRSLLGGEGVASTEETAWAVRKLLEAAARRRPLVAVLDDLHWAEPTLLDLVEHVADLARDAPILLLCMARPDLLDRRPGWSGGKLNAATVLLEPLTPEETDLLLGSLLGGTTIADELRERVRTTAEGNPLFVEEMVAMLRDSPSSEDAVPPTIQALLAARLDQLATSERAVLERGAVEGRVFHRGAVLALAPDGTRVDVELAKLVRKELVRPDTPQLPAEDAFRFRHLLIRDAAYDALPKAARADLHERFAHWLDARAADLIERDEIVGYHLEQAHNYRAALGPLDDRGRELGRRAAALLSASGTRALDRGDGPAAANLLERAIAVEPSDSRRAELLPLLAAAVADTGNYPRAQSLLDEAIALAATRPAGAAAARARLFRCHLARHLDPPVWYREIDREAVAAAEVFASRDDERGLAQCARLLGLARWDDLQLARAEEHLREAVERSRSVGDVTETRLSLQLLAYVYANGPKPVPAGEQELARLRELGGGDLLVEAAVLEAQSVLAIAAGRTDDGRTLCDRGIAIYEELGLRGRAVLPRFRRAHWDVVAGDAEAAEQAARRAVDELERMGEIGWRSTATAVLGTALAALGRFEEARQCAEESRTLGNADDLVNEIWWRYARTAAHTGLGELAEAERLAREGVALTAPTEAILFHAEALTLLARVLHASGRDDEAAGVVAEAVAVADRKQAQLVAARARAALG
jgi:class 3 adenylate cyclase/tetratricopeptide (TPR) repeat protein